MSAAYERAYEEALARRAAILAQFDDPLGSTYTDIHGYVYNRYTYQRIAFVDQFGRICDPNTYAPLQQY